MLNSLVQLHSPIGTNTYIDSFHAQNVDCTTNVKELVNIICSRQAFGLIMDLIGKGAFARSLMEIGTMVTESTLGLSEDRLLSPIRLTPTAGERISVEGGYGGRRIITRPTPDDWEAFRPIFTYYYKVKNLPLPAVRRIMARQYSFVAT